MALFRLLALGREDLRLTPNTLLYNIYLHSDIHRTHGVRTVNKYFKMLSIVRVCIRFPTVTSGEFIAIHILHN